MAKIMKSLQRAKEFAKNIEGEATRQKLDELKHLYKCFVSEVENNNRVKYPSTHESMNMLEFKSSVYELLLSIMFMAEAKNKDKEYIISILNKI
jgi:hypothetical protein